MNLTRKKVVIGLIILFVVLPLIAYAIFLLNNREDKSEAYLKDAVVITKDKDTGAVLSDDPNLSDQASERRDVVILGLQPLIEQGILPAQTTFIKDQLNAYAKNILKDKYETLTIRPQDLVYTDGVFTTTLRLGQSDNIIPITITASDTGETRIVVTDDPDSTNGGSFDSGVMTYYGE